jgi:hypothetical protein
MLLKQQRNSVINDTGTLVGTAALTLTGKALKKWCTQRDSNS